MPDGTALNLRAARHVAVVTLFAEFVDSAEARPAADRHPSERLLLAAVDLEVMRLLQQSLDAARDEMGALAPAVLDR